MLKLGAAQMMMGVQLQATSRLSLAPCLRIGNARASAISQIGIHPMLPAVLPVRQSSFYKAGDSDELWKTMAGVSQQGKKRGRAKNTMQKKDLNRGQRLGYGKAKIAWPVLVTKATGTVKGGEVETGITEMKEGIYERYQQSLEEERKKNSYGGRGKKFTHPLDRGWAGGRPLGKKFGPPMAANKEITFDNFETILLEFKTVYHMTGNLGRVRRNSILMCTGNGQGAVGFTVSAGKYGQNAKALRKAVNKAGLRLVYVDRFEDRTVYHDFFSQFGHSKVFVQQQPPGYGIRAHRAIRAICQMCGIKDLYVKCEGSLNVQSVVKAFVLGLLRQRTHQALADEKQLHLVEMRKESDYYPRVVASPSDGKVRTQEEIDHNEILDFEMISFEGHKPQWRPGQSGGPEKRNPWELSPGWGKHMRRNYAAQAAASVRRRMRIEKGPQWGAVSSHLYQKYPECVERDWPKATRMSRERKAAEGD